jgi:zinc protease
MLSGRLDEISQQNEAPFLYAGSGYSGFVRSKDAYFSSAQAKEGGIKESLKILLTENNRVLQHGFTESELERQKLSIYKRAENSAKEMDKTTSSNLAMQCVYHFLNNSPMFGANKELQLMKEFLPTIKIEEVNKLAKNWIIDKNRAVVITAPEKESMVIPTEDEIKKILADYGTVATEAYKDKFLDMPLMAKVPTAGTVIEEKTIEEKELNITEYTLSNGIRVIMKPTDFQNDKILFNAYSPGGHSLYGDEDFRSASNAAVMIEQAGLGAFDMIALEKKLTGKTVQISPYISELYEGFYGSSSVEDFETLLKLVHLYGTQPRKDKESFDRIISQNKEQLRNLGSSPRVFFQNELSKIKFNGHMRRIALPTEADMDKIDYERIYEIYNERFSDFSDFTFVFVGNFEPAKIKSLLELYLASLPNTNRKETWTDIGLELPQNGVVTNLQKGLAPQANVYMGFVQETPWTPEKSFEITAMSKVLSIMVRENLREDKGGVYSPYVGGGLQNKPLSYADLTVYFQCAPENVENLVTAVKEEVTSLIENGPSDENYNKVKETLRRGRESNLEKNSFWRNALVSYSKIDRSMTEIFDYNRFLDQLTKKRYPNNGQTIFSY